MKNRILRLLGIRPSSRLGGKGNPVALHLTNTDPHAAPGGLERYVLQSARFSTEHGFASALCFPSRKQSGSFDILLSSGESVTLTEEEFVHELDRAELHSFHLQHMMNWDRDQLRRICESAFKKTSITRTYIHDYFFTEVEERRSFSRSLLPHFEMIVAPSETARNVFSRALPELSAKIEVLPHFTVQDLGPADPAPKGEKIALIFSGACGFNKGIQNYQELIAVLGERFRWVTVGIEDRFHESPLVEHRHYSFHEQMDLGAILESLKPAVAFQGSVVPETFSFSTHEMLEAGIPVLTTDASGNISATVEKLGAGKTYVSFDGMKDDLAKNGERVFAELIANAHRYRCEWNIEAFRRIYSRREM